MQVVEHWIMNNVVATSAKTQTDKDVFWDSFRVTHENIRDCEREVFFTYFGSASANPKVWNSCKVTVTKRRKRNRGYMGITVKDNLKLTRIQQVTPWAVNALSCGTPEDKLLKEEIWQEFKKTAKVEISRDFFCVVGRTCFR